MRAKTLLICDKETEYARRLAEFISSRHEYTFRVHYCDDMETAQALAGKMAIDYALIDNRFPEEERKAVKADRMFALTEHPGEEAAEKRLLDEVCREEEEDRKRCERQDCEKRQNPR